MKYLKNLSFGRYIVLVCRADQCIGPGPEFGDSPIPAGNCGPVSSDIHMLDRHVRILYEFM
jgi:hypothetical protein